MKKAVVTGATGAIGLALINELTKRNIEVLVLCRKGSSRNAQIPANPLIKKEECNLDGLYDFVPRQGDYDVFFHLAWAGTTGKARENIYLQNQNIKYSLDAVYLANKLGCKRFVGVGSQAEYGVTTEKLSSLTPVFPETGYGIAKLSAGLLTRKLAQQLEMKHLWVRVLSVYGPNDGANSMISMLIRNLSMNRPINMTACTQMWDYLYSVDAAQALYLLAEKGKDGKTYVLGSGTARPLKEYVEIIKKEMHSDLEIGYGLIPFSEKQVMYLCADISEIKKDTGWVPQTEFPRGINNILSSVG